MTSRPWSLRVGLLTALTATLALGALATLPARAPTAPAPVPRKPAVEVVFVLDTTGSMGGLIEGAKIKIWAICNQIINGRPTPDLKVGLVAFKDKGDDYVTQVHDLTHDLDQVYSTLRTFTANGGGDAPEAVNQALDDAVNKVKWSTDKKTLKIIFLVGDAPPHMDYPDDVKYPVTCKKALEQNILVNTIQCGTDEECKKYWTEIAALSAGSYVQIPQAGGIKALSTPFDKRLAEINTELAKTTLVYGSAAKKDADGKKIREAGELKLEAAADRVGFLAKEGRAATYDLLDDLRTGKVKLASLKDEELPTVMQKMSPDERRDHLDKVGKVRAGLFKEAGDLDKQRTLHISSELSKTRDSFDGQVLDMLRKQADKRIRY